MPSEGLLRTRELLSLHERRYRHSAWFWKLGYRVLLLSSALLSTSAAVIGELDYYTPFFEPSDVAAILAAAAAVITTLIAALDFEVNWRINRRSRHEVGVIALESEKSTADPDTLLTELQQVVKRRNEDLNKQD